jgi:hypothetical protein
VLGLPKRPNLAPVLALLTLASSPSGAHARDSSTFSISGFGTLGAVYHTTDGAEFRRDISHPDGALAHRWSFDQDSMLGVQATVRPSESLEATLQLVSRNSIDVGYRPQVAWAFAKWKPLENVALRVGRIGIDLYLQGDSAEIGYANLLVRQPLIFYPRLADGMDAEWTTPLGTATLRLKGQWGKTTGKLIYSNDAPYDTEGSVGSIFIAEYAQGGWTGRVSAGRLTLKDNPDDAHTQALLAGLAMAPRGADVLAAISLKDRRMAYVTAAVAYDAGPIQGTVGYDVLSTPHIPDMRSIYAQAGYRLGRFTPYAAYTRQTTDRTLVSTGFSQGLSPLTDALNQGAAIAQSSMWANQSITAIGLRYDLAPNTALKLQVDRIRYQDSWGITDPRRWSESTSERGYGHMTLCSGALEFVF